MIYKNIITKKVRDTFLDVQHHNYDAVLRGINKNVYHHFAGNHALGGTRHDTDALRKWFERLGRVFPELTFEVKDVIVKGMPWNTLVIARWVATTKLINGESYVNPGVHFISIRWGKAYKFEVYEDTQVVANGLAEQAESGIREAIAEKIES